MTWAFGSELCLMDDQGFQEVCACSRCGEIFDDDASVALHWAESGCQASTVEEARAAFGDEPERFRTVLAFRMDGSSFLDRSPPADGDADFLD
jgi:hypothetical protein